jgi:hypothetical protein
MKPNREQAYEEDDKLLRKKWNTDYKNGKITIGNITPNRSGNKTNNEIKNRQVILNYNNEIEIVETCLRCNKEKPITPKYYHSEYNNSGINNIYKESGKEQFCNSQTYGCRECSKIISKQKGKQIDEYKRILLKPYPLLQLEWYNLQQKYCAISNLRLNEENNCDWRVSIQNNGSTKEHRPENCILIAYEFNVQEQYAIHNLIDCWKKAFSIIIQELRNNSDTRDIIEYVKKWYNNSPTDNGVTEPSQITNKDNQKIRNPEYSKQYNTKHFKAILNGLCDRYFKMDKKSIKRKDKNSSRLNSKILFNKLINQEMKCYYTGIPLSTDRDDWRYFSLERLDNILHHTEDNTVFICRMFNTAGQLNKKKILKALLSQQHIQLSSDDINLINNKLETI